MYSFDRRKRVRFIFLVLTLVMMISVSNIFQVSTTARTEKVYAFESEPIHSGDSVYSQLSISIIAQSDALEERTESLSYQRSRINDWEKEFQAYIDDVIKEIAEKDSQFSTWQQATWKSYPFGPGSKQWIILLTDDGEEVGYLIIGEKETKELILIEYGINHDDIFSQHVLNEQQAFTEQFVYSGLLWAIETEDHILKDMITLELYKHVNIQDVEPYWKGHHVKSLLTLTEQESVKQEPIVYIKREQSIKESELDLNHSYIYDAYVLPDVRGIYDITSWHQWSLEEGNKMKYVGLKDGGVRFLSCEYLQEIGHFTRR